ncbi:PKD domain-containing protein, partial [candidate division KSB1 bacterium]
MKRAISTLFYLFFNVLFIVQAYGQLSGTYTIGSGAGANYSSYGAAISALNSNGISGPVIFNVSPGTYTEQITLTNITGASSSNTITFQSANGDSTSVILTFPSSSSSTNNHLIYLNGADYIILKKMTFQRTGTSTYARLIVIANNAQYNKFINNRMLGIQTTSANLNSIIVYANNNSINSNNEISGNIIQNGSYGIYYFGNSSNNPDNVLVIDGNVINNPFGSAIYIGYVDVVEINNNIINATSTYSSFSGIYTFYSDGALRIKGNKISLQSGKGIYVHNCDGAGLNVGLLANNFISVGGNGTAQGINLSYATNQHVYYNSVNITSSSSNSGMALYLDGLTTANNDIVNNNLVNSGGGYTYYVTINTNSPISLSNHNNLFSATSNLAFWKSIMFNSLSSWKTTTSLDNNSVSVNPLYLSTTDLHASSTYINGAGTSSLSSLTPVNDDIDGELRNNPPDIGADEFNIYDLGISAIILDTVHCHLSEDSIKVWIKNYSSSTFSGNIDLYYRINYQNAVTDIINNISINGMDSIFYVFSTPLMFDSVGSFTLTSGTLINTDNDHSNDSIYGFSFQVNPSPFADAGSDQIICYGDSVLLVASGIGSYFWSTGQTTQSIFVAPPDTSFYSLTVTNQYNCASIDTVIVNVLNLPDPVAGFTYTVLPSGLDVEFTSTSTNASYYFWDFGDGFIDTISNPIHSFSGNGNYTVKLIAYNECKEDSADQIIALVGINEFLSEEGIIVYPNPTNGLIYIDNSNFGYEIDNISVINNAGLIIDEPMHNPCNPGEICKVDLSEYSNGLYLNCHS